MEPYRPEQRTPVSKISFLAGSYTRQDYIDSIGRGHAMAVAWLLR